MIKKISVNWSLDSWYNDETEYTQVFIYHINDGAASVACAENEGELDNGTQVPGYVVAAAHRFEDSLN